MATAAVLQPRDMNTLFNRSVAVSASRFVPRSTQSSGRTISSCSRAKSHRRLRGGLVDWKRKKEKELLIEKVRILKRGEILCPNLSPNLVKCSATMNKKNEVVMDRFAGAGFTMAPHAINLPMPKMNWLQKSEAEVENDDVDVGAGELMDVMRMAWSE